MAVVLVLVVALALALVVQFVVRPRLGRRGQLALDAVIDIDAERELRRQTSYAVLRRVYPGLYAPGGPVMRKKATAHLAMLGRTLVVRAEAAPVEAAVRRVVAAQDHFEQCPAGPDEILAWRLTGSLVGPLPRMSIRRSRAVPGSFEVGVTDYGWGLQFPQGGPVAERCTAAIAAAFAQARLPHREYLRGFAPVAGVRTDLGSREGRWTVEALLPADTAPGADLGEPAW